jgi:CBS-domain-containing membrane protein
MKAAELMTRGVLSVTSRDSARKAAELMLRYGVTGFPVLDQGKLVGMITQGDFLRRVETGTAADQTGAASVFADAGVLADQYAHSRGRTVADVMTRDVVTVSAETPLNEVVRLMARHHISRLPVVGANDGVLGILSRADVLHAYLVATPKEPSAPLDDDAITRRLKAEFECQPWIPSGSIKFSVDHGVVALKGTIRDPRQRNALRIAAENIPGVKQIVEDLHEVELTLPR